MKSTSVILALICITALLDITVGDDEIVDCSNDPSVCSDLQCCLYDDFNNIACRSLSREDEECVFDYNADMIRVATYGTVCPCMKGLTCVQNDDPVDRDTFRPGICQPDNNGLTTGLPKNLHGIQN